MSLPTTLTKVYNALVRGLPSFFSGKLLLEAHSFAVALARANDVVEGMVAELFPDTATLSSIDRWERTRRVPSRPGDDLQTRRNRVLTVEQRVNGPQPAKLESMLVNLLACAPNQVLLIEQLRASIEAAMTLTTGTIAMPIPGTLTIGAPFPGVIDDQGISLYLRTSVAASVNAKLTHPDGTSVTFSGTTDLVTREILFRDRATFLGKSAAANWTISVTGAPTSIQEARLFVSNDQDSAQIYRFYAVRDASLGGAPDITEAQRQFTRHALAHMVPSVAEHTAMICDEGHSLCDREPVGV